MSELASDMSLKSEKIQAWVAFEPMSSTMQMHKRDT